MIDFKNKTILTFFAHPDDETLAAGGTLAKLSRLGTNIYVVIPATGIHARSNVQTRDKRNQSLIILRRDCQKALKILGVPAKNIYLGEFSDNELDKHSRLELVHWLEGIMAKVKPDIIFTHHRYCTNIDHQYCHEAAVIAARPVPKKHIAIISCEVPSSTGYLKPTQWEPSLYIEITKKDLEKKIRAMKIYRGEIRPDPHPRSPEVLRAYAKVRGSESGYFFAEAFMIQKILVSS